MMSNEIITARIDSTKCGFGVSCLLCGECIPSFRGDTNPRICENCKKIWAEIRKERGDKDA